MVRKSLLDELFSTSAPKRMGNKIILKNPSSTFNYFKRTLAFIIGAVFIFLFIIAVMTVKDPKNEIGSVEIGAVLFFGFGLIYYSVKRTKIHKTCFIDFREHSLKARIPAPLSVYPQGNALMWALMFHPQFDEFDCRFDELQTIEIKTTKIILTHKSGTTKVINLENFEYNIIKAVKSKFDNLIIE